MAKKLKNLVITKVALVDEGSCSAAHIKLFKRKEGGNTMNFEEILKSLTPEQQATVKAEMAKKALCPICGKADGECTCKADMEEAQKSCKNLKKEKENLETELSKAKGVDPNASEEELLKNVDPAIRAILEKSRKEAAANAAIVKKMKEDSDKAEALAKAKEVNLIGAKEEDLTSVLVKLKNTDDKLAEDVFGILKAANAVIAKGEDITKSHGTNQDPENVDDLEKARDAAWTKIEKAADAIAKSRKISQSAAITAVIDEQPDLYDAYVKTMI